MLKNPIKEESWPYLEIFSYLIAKIQTMVLGIMQTIRKYFKYYSHMSNAFSDISTCSTFYKGDFSVIENDVISIYEFIAQKRHSTILSTLELLLWISNANVLYFLKVDSFVIKNDIFSIYECVAQDKDPHQTNY